MTKIISDHDRSYATHINVIKLYSMCELILEQQATILAKLNSTTEEQELSKSKEALRVKFNNTSDEVKRVLDTHS